jgi:hypothetical protein
MHAPSYLEMLEIVAAYLINIASCIILPSCP